MKTKSPVLKTTEPMAKNKDRQQELRLTAGIELTGGKQTNPGRAQKKGKMKAASVLLVRGGGSKSRTGETKHGGGRNQETEAWAAAKTESGRVAAQIWEPGQGKTCCDEARAEQLSSAEKTHAAVTLKKHELGIE
jgi:hypothetical protein